jgi:hypothetical protein
MRFGAEYGAVYARSIFASGFHACRSFTTPSRALHTIPSWLLASHLAQAHAIFSTFSLFLALLLALVCCLVAFRSSKDAEFSVTDGPVLTVCWHAA